MGGQVLQRREPERAKLLAQEAGNGEEYWRKR
jgi:hypothetical protein